jgi:hypothetical protein
MQNPYRPIIIKFATKVTTFFRACPRENMIPCSLFPVTCYLLPDPDSSIKNTEYPKPVKES